MKDLLKEDDARIYVDLWVTGESKINDYKIKEEVCERFVISSSTDIPRPDLKNSYQFQK
jgi:hypothetical protein